MNKTKKKVSLVGFQVQEAPCASVFKAVELLLEGKTAEAKQILAKEREETLRKAEELFPNRLPKC